MTALTVIAYVIGCIICLIIILFGFIKLMTYLADKGAVKKGKRYCIEKGYEFKRVEIYPNHYGIFLSYQKMQIYASFDYERDGSLTWKKGSPEEKIRKRLDKKK